LSSVEREIKLRLADEASWLRLQAVLGDPSASLDQVNVYLDTPSLEVAGRRGMLRLRGQDGVWSLTWKRGLRMERGYFEALEVECPLDEAAGQCPDLSVLEHLPPVRALRADGIAEPLALRGEVRNLRQRYPLTDCAVLELDRTTFPGGRVEFEVEVETLHPEQVTALLEDLARRAGVVLLVQDRTKYERFLEATLDPLPGVSTERQPKATVGGGFRATGSA
jgi:uncharacterized protein YjbK